MSAGKTDALAPDGGRRAAGASREVPPIAPVVRRLRDSVGAIDPRIYQVLFLGSLLLAGALARDFSLRPEQVALTFAAGIGVQAACVRTLGLASVGVLSAVITCFGLATLLRADSLWVHPVAACIAIGAKFVVRAHGRHLFNPANLGVVAGLLLLPGTWVSAGQWGSEFVAAAWFIALGALVTNRARRADISWMFLAAYLGLVAARVWWLGQGWPVFWHQAHSGALLLFAFFMISDPMTAPNRRAGRALHALIVAAVAFAWQFWWFRPDALIWALFFAAPLVPFIDRLLPGERYGWRSDPRESRNGAA